MLYRGCGYKVSGMNAQGVATVLQKPDNFFSHPAVVNNTTQKKIIISSFDV